MPRIRIVDFETDGLAPPDAVIEVGTSDLLQTDQGWQIDPGCATLHAGPLVLKPEARAIHHIAPVDLAGKPPFDPAEFVSNAAFDDVIILAAHNWNFEGQWLTEDILAADRMRALCTYKAALRIWPDAPSHSNGALRYWLEDQGLIRPEHLKTQPPHRAGPDAYVTAWLLKALLEHATAREMVAWTREPALLPRCPIGEAQGWRGKKWSEIDGGFLNWMTLQKIMEADLKWNAQRELYRRMESGG